MLSSLGYYLWGNTTDPSEPLDKVSFTINGKVHTIDASTCPVDTSLTVYLRNYAFLRGTKFMCHEGGCGVCTVNIERHDPVTNEKESLAVNSCLLLVFACHGLEITTIEGLGNRKDGYHPLQKRLAEYNGSQCGMCSPGMVMTMYSLLKGRKGKVSTEEVEKGFGGNLCRCTGYRSILDAFKSMAMNSVREDEVDEICGDIEDLPKICSKSGNFCNERCSVRDDKRNIRIVFEDGREWHRVYALQDVLSILTAAGDKPYILICGDTEHGVYRRPENLQVFIDCNFVVELHEVSISDVITIGGNISLARFKQILEEAASTNQKFKYCKEIAKHLEKVAHPLVRNVGSIAGNLSLKNQHREFPSDVFILLEAVGAKLSIVDVSGGSITQSPQDFVMSNAQKKVIKTITLPALDPKQHTFRSFRIALRTQHAHAYVNSAFLLKVNNSNTVIEEAKLCFGGISPEFVHAHATEQLLANRNIFNNDSLQAALTTLSDELNPNWILPDASADYRKNLALSLFYKFILDIAPQDQLKPQYKSGGTILERPISSGKQTYDTHEQKWPLTENVPKLEGLVQCAGEAEYVNDMPPIPGELHAAFVGATEVHCKVVSVDPAEALKLAGVVGFFTAKDIPGANNYTPAVLGFPYTEEILCSGEVLFYNQPIGVIVANTFAIAIKASTLVEVTYEKLHEQPIYPTLKFALSESAELTSSNAVEVVGEKHLQDELQSNTKIIGRMELAGQAHFSLETQSCICVPTEDGMDVFVATQWMGLNQVAIAQMLNVPQNRITINVKRLGGSFGGKVSRVVLISCSAALAAHLTNRPVRFHLSLESNMEIIGKRYGCISNYEVNVDENGRILKLTNYFAQDYGATFNEPLIDSLILSFPNGYDNRTWKIVAKMVKTDVPKNTWCRAPGSTEAIATIETIIDHISFATGKDPLEVRLANMPSDSRMRQLIPDYLKSIEFDSRRKTVDVFNANNRWKKRGIAWVQEKYQIDFHGRFNALVSIYQGDGTVVVTHGGIEMGQGVNTKVAQIIASILGIPLNMVSVKQSTSWTSANTDPSGGGIVSDSVCYATKEACYTLLERIKSIRDKNPNASWFELIQICYAASVDLSVNFMFKATDIKPYFIWSLCSTEVEIDVLTGNIIIQRLDIQQDVGDSLSPGIDIGQVEGATVMGLGYHLLEDLIYENTTGRLLTNRTWNYKIPGALDIPVDFRVSFLRGSPSPFGVLRSKSVGEAPLSLSVVVLSALRYALRSARRDAGLPDDWIPLGTGSTPEHIFTKAGNSKKQFLLS